MFQTLDEEIEITESGRPTVSTRLVRLAGIAITFFVALYFAIVSFE